MEKCVVQTLSKNRFFLSVRQGRRRGIGLASATSQLDRNAWQRVATYKSGSKQTWRRVFFVWNHIEKAQTDRTPAQLPLC